MHALVRQGGFVVAGGDGPVLLEPVEAAHDDVAALVSLTIERGWATAATAASAAVVLVAAFGSDPATAQIATDRAAGKGLVGQHPARTRRSGEPDPGQQVGESRGVVGLPAGQQDRHGLPCPSQVLHSEIARKRVTAPVIVADQGSAQVDLAP